MVRGVYDVVRQVRSFWAESKLRLPSVKNFELPKLLPVSPNSPEGISSAKPVTKSLPVPLLEHEQVKNLEALLGIIIESRSQQGF